jgi:hypothetical protein
VEIKLQHELFTAKELRDEALARVEVNSGGWSFLAMAAVANIPGGWRGSGEALRLHLLANGLEQPHHHNAWGSVVRNAVRRGLLRETGRVVHMRTPKSHARRTPEYERR